MGIQIEDGLGTGVLAAINSEHRLRTLGISGGMSTHVSVDDVEGGVYTVIATATIAGAGTYYPFFIINNDPSFLLIPDRIMVEVVGTTGGTAIPNAGDYFSLLFNTTYTSGGTAFTPTNLNRTSTKVANVTAYYNNPTLGVASAIESHRWYSQANGVAFELIRPETNDIILGRSNTLAVRYITATTAGTILVTIKFMLTTIDDIP